MGKPITCRDVGPWVVYVDQPRKRRGDADHDYNVKSFLVLGPLPGPGKLRPSVAWGTFRPCHEITIVGGVLPDSVRTYLKTWPAPPGFCKPPPR